MNYVYDPEVAAKIAAYVNYVTPVVGAKEVLAKTDPELAEQRADLPERRDARQAAPVRRPRRGRGAPDERGDAGGRRRVTRCAGAGRCGRWRCWRPGLLWLLVFFAIPALNQLYVSLQEGTLERGYAFDVELGRLRRRDLPATTSSSCARSATRRPRRCSRWSSRFPLAYFIAFKAGRWKNLLLLLIILPFFTSYLVRTVAWQTILSDDGPVVELPADGRAARRRRAAAGDAHGGDRRHHLQLPAVHGAAAVRVAGEGRPAADRGGDRPLRAPRDRVPQGHAAAGAAGHPRRLAADLHPGGRRLHQRAAARDVAPVHDRQRHPVEVPRDRRLPGGRGAVVRADGRCCS